MVTHNATRQVLRFSVHGAQQASFIRKACILDIYTLSQFRFDSRPRHYGLGTLLLHFDRFSPPEKHSRHPVILMYHIPNMSAILIELGDIPYSERLVFPREASIIEVSLPVVDLCIRIAVIRREEDRVEVFVDRSSARNNNTLGDAIVDGISTAFIRTSSPIVEPRTPALLSVVGCQLEPVGEGKCECSEGKEY